MRPTDGQKPITFSSVMGFLARFHGKQVHVGGMKLLADPDNRFSSRHGELTGIRGIRDADQVVLTIDGEEHEERYCVFDIIEFDQTESFAYIILFLREFGIFRAILIELDPEPTEEEMEPVVCPLRLNPGVIVS